MFSYSILIIRDYLNLIVNLSVVKSTPGPRDVIVSAAGKLREGEGRVGGE